MDRYGKAVDRGVYELWQLHAERNALQKAYLDRWNAAGLDAIICMSIPLFITLSIKKLFHFISVRPVSLTY